MKLVKSQNELWLIYVPIALYYIKLLILYRGPLNIVLYIGLAFGLKKNVKNHNIQRKLFVY